MHAALKVDKKQLKITIIMSNNSSPKVSEEQLGLIMETIQSKLPEGYYVTNKRPVQKEVRAKTSASADIYWSSWVKKEGSKTSMLALIDNHTGKVKILSQDEIKRDYSIRSI